VAHLPVYTADSLLDPSYGMYSTVLVGELYFSIDILLRVNAEESCVLAISGSQSHRPPTR
jgi:hypothetical protein